MLIVKLQRTGKKAYDTLARFHNPINPNWKIIKVSFALRYYCITKQNYRLIVVIKLATAFMPLNKLTKKWALALNDYNYLGQGIRSFAFFTIVFRLQLLYKNH